MRSGNAPIYSTPFGNILESTGDVNNNITYAGYQYDEETELYYLNARMYDPKVARFLQEDTYRGDVRDPLSLNLYTYCHNEPIMYFDPTGRWREGDSDRPVLVQLALMKLSDKWNKENNIQEKHNIELLANEIRSEGLNHPYLNYLFRLCFTEEQIKEIEKIEVVDKEKERLALEDGIITMNEWTEMRNVAIFKDEYRQTHIYI